LKFRLKPSQRVNVAVFLAVSTLSSTFAVAQVPADPPSLNEPPSDGSPDDRIFGVIPNYLTVEKPQPHVAPLTVEQKFELFAKETFDPFTFATSAAGAGLSQINNDNPKYGYGAGAYGDRFGAAVADVTTQNFFSDAVLASLLHEDPRYFRRGPEYGVWSRVGYALSRTFVTRTDAGKDRFNYSGILGMSMGIGLSNAYYPDASVNGEEVASRFGTSLLATALGNLLPEFWPDIHEKLLHRKSHHPNQPVTPPPAPGD